MAAGSQAEGVPACSPDPQLATLTAPFPSPPAPPRSTWAEIAARRDPAHAISLLCQAGEAYQAALQREEDALSWSNLADALVQRASLCCEAGQGQQGGALFQEAMQVGCGLMG